MTCAEYEARVKIIKYLIWVRRQYVQDNEKLTGRPIEPYVPADEIALQAGVSVSVIRKALKGCSYVEGRTGKAGGYRLSLAPKELLEKAKAISNKNKQSKNPAKWVRTVKLTANDLISPVVMNKLKMDLAAACIAEAGIKAILSKVAKQLEKEVLYEYNIGTYEQNYL